MNCPRPVILTVFLLLICTPLYALPAFPGAEGMGASSMGGRGGAVYKVTNLNDSGTGSFRAACTASGPRIVVFAVSGVINLTSDLTINNPYITIAGQTSPGGICIAGRTFIVHAHDVVITHMRFRCGSHGGGDLDTRDAVQVNGSSDNSDPTYNVVFDHCSFSWGVDETVNINYTVYDCTFSWCSFLEGLTNAGHSEGNHSAGLFIWGRYNAQRTSVTVHHSFFGFNYFRIPEANFNSFIDVSNCVNYYWHSTYTMNTQSMNDGGTLKYSRANYRHNYIDVRSGEGNSQDLTYAAAEWGTCTPSQTIYMNGCLDGHRTSQSQSQWSVGTDWHQTVLSTSWRRDTPWDTTDIPVTITTMTPEYARTVVQGAGALYPVRDSVDATATANYIAGTGGYRANVVYPTDWPTFSTPAAPTDSDNDGMADTWEISTFGSIAATPTADADGDGYTNIEEYLHYLGGYSSGQVVTPPTSDTTPPAVPGGVNITPIQ